MLKEKKDLWFYIIASTMLLTTLSIIVEPFVNQSSVTNYSVHIMLLMLLVSLSLMAFGRVQSMFIGLFCTMLIALFLRTASNTALMLPEQNEEPKIKVSHYNLGNIESNFDEIYKEILADSADVISFQEYTPDWSALIKNQLHQDFPFHKEVVRIDPYGVALYSKMSFEKVDTFMLNNKPSLEIMIEQEGKPFNIISSYVIPSLDNKSRQSAIKQLKGIANKIAERSVPVIALGEYNLVYWSQELRRFVSEANLKNSRRSIAQGNLRIPYDHIFYSKDLQCIEFKELKDRNFNHIGIAGTYQHLRDTSKDK